MPIVFRCPACQHQSTVEDGYAGVTGRCVNCGVHVTVRGGKPRRRWGWIAVVGVVLLAALGLVIAPVAFVVLEATHEARCHNHMYQIGLALRNYDYVYGAFPPAVVRDERGRAMHSWRVLLLSFLGEDDLYSQYRWSEPWDGPNNVQLMDRCPDIYRCPGDSSAPWCSSYRVVIDPETPWQEDRTVPMTEIFDGTAYTIAIVEFRGGSDNWLNPTELTIPQFVANASAERSKGHGIHVVMMDGSTRHLGHTDVNTIYSMLKHADGRPWNEEY